MKRRLLLIFALGALVLATPASTAKKTPGETAPLVIERPPLIAAAPGPAGTPWAHCAVLLEGRTQGEPAPHVSTLCIVDGKPEVTTLAPTARKSRVVAAEAGPGGGLRVLFGRPGGIDEIDVDAPGGAPRVVRLIEDDALNPYSLKDRPDLDGDGTKDLLQATYEGLVGWIRSGDGGVARVAGPRVPPFASSFGEQVTLSGRTILTPLEADPVRWTWPETIAGRRLRMYRAALPPATGEPCAAWIDARAPLYAADAVILAGDKPRLAALVAPSDKIAIFGNLSLFVAPLSCDETARGSRPTLVEKTAFEANIGWTTFAARDVTGDGRLDILYYGRQGVLNEKLQVAVHHGLPDGGFSAKAATGERSDLDPIGARWEKDADGDGRVDLVVLDQRRALLARGRVAPKVGDLPVDLQRAAVVELPGSVKPRRLVELVDFDGDGRLEALIAGEEREEKRKGDKPEVSVGGAIPRAEKNAQLVIVRFPPAAP